MFFPLSSKEKKLIQEASALCSRAGRTMIKGGGSIKSVGCVVVTKKGQKFYGVCMDLACGIGFCAEHAAIAQMVTQTNETKIDIIVASSRKEVLSPCGRCRELMNLLDNYNLNNTFVIISKNEKIKLRELLPMAWQPE